MPSSPSPANGSSSPTSAGFSTSIEDAGRSSRKLGAVAPLRLLRCDLLQALGCFLPIAK